MKRGMEGRHPSSRSTHLPENLAGCVEQGTALQPFLQENYSLQRLIRR